MDFFLHKCSVFCVRNFKGKMVGLQLESVGCIQDNWVCIHMNGTLPMACSLEWHLLSPFKADSCAIKWCGTSSQVVLHWVWFFALIINAKCIYTVCSRVCVFKNHEKMLKSRGDNLSNNDCDTVSQSLKDQKVNLQKWTLSVPPWAQEAASKGWT